MILKMCWWLTIRRHSRVVGFFEKTPTTCFLFSASNGRLVYQVVDAKKCSQQPIKLSAEKRLRLQQKASSSKKSSKHKSGRREKKGISAKILKNPR